MFFRRAGYGTPILSSALFTSCTTPPAAFSAGSVADPTAFSTGPVAGSRVFSTESTIGSTALWTGSRTGSAGFKTSSTGARIWVRGGTSAPGGGVGVGVGVGGGVGGGAEFIDGRTTSNDAAKAVVD